MPEDHRLIVGKELVKANEAAVKKFGKVRGLKLPKGAKLEPEGINVINFHMAQETSVRCQVLCKVEGKASPVFAWVDLEWDTFNSLKTWDDIKDAVEAID